MTYHIGECPLCRGYGRMEIIYNFPTGKVSVMCEECGLEFDNVSDYLNKKNGYRTFLNIGDEPSARDASEDEIKNSEWYSLVTEKF